MRHGSNGILVARVVLRPALCVAVVLTSLTDCEAEGPLRPNIVLILADDLGWHDLNCYGSAVFETPHLDRLAQEGLRFTQAYAPAPICSASRAGLLTGKTPARLGFEFVTKSDPGVQQVAAPLRAPPYTLDLPLEEITLADALRDSGYRTAFFGKWHVSRHHGSYLGWSQTHGPTAQGFDVAEEDFGSHPYSYWSDRSQREFVKLPEGQFPVDSMTQRAIRFLQSENETPFFLMVSHFYVHTPVHTRTRWLYRRCLDRVPADHPRREALAVYSAMVTALDHYVGELLAALDDAGLTDSTLVLFTSDNGGHPEYAGNAPLRGSKWNLYEGGIRVPLLARWPQKIPAGSVTDAVASGIDLLPTLTELAGADVPERLDGRSLVPTFMEPDGPDEPRALLWHFPYYHPEQGFRRAPAGIGVNDGVTSQTRPHSCLRMGDWKLLRFHENGTEELYHLPTDVAEQQNRIEAEAAIAAQLRQALETHLRESKSRMPVPIDDDSRKTDRPQP